MISRIITETCDLSYKGYKILTGRNNEGNETATGQMNDTVGRQQMQEDQRPISHKQRRAERQEGRAGVTADAIRVRDEDKRGSGDRGKGSREHQLQTQQGIVDYRQKSISDAQEQRDGRIKEMQRTIDGQRQQITSLTQERDRLGEEARARGEKLTRSEWESRNLQRQIHDLEENMRRSESNGHAL